MNTMDDLDDVAFRPAARSRGRALLGISLVALAIAGNLAVYGSMDDRTAVLQIARDVPAGAVVTDDDLRVVDLGVDPTVRVVEATRRPEVIGRVAKVRLVSGSVLVGDALQDGSLVTPGAGVVALQVPEGAVPAGVRERSAVLVVLPPERHGGADDRTGPVVIEATVVALPVPAASMPGRVSISVEVEREHAATLAASDDPRIVLVEPNAASAPSDPIADPIAEPAVPTEEGGA